MASAFERVGRYLDLDWRGSVGAKSLTMMFARVRIVTVSEGEITTVHIGLKGAMNALYLEDLAEKTRRDLRGRVEAGRSGGGVSYGYRVVRVPEGEARGDRENNATERSASNNLPLIRRICGPTHLSQHPFASPNIGPNLL